MGRPLRRCESTLRVVTRAFELTSPAASLSKPFREIYANHHHVHEGASAEDAVHVGTVALVSVTVSGQRPKFYSDDPIARVEDTRDASSVQPKSVNLIYDETINLFGNPGDPDMNRRSMSINTIDEVPDSSWFTNRVGGLERRGCRQGTRHRDWTGSRQMDACVRQERRDHAGLHDSRRGGRPLVHQVRSAEMARDGQRRRSGRDETVSRARLQRSGKPHREAHAREPRDRRPVHDHGRRRRRTPSDRRRRRQTVENGGAGA